MSPFKTKELEELSQRILNQAVGQPLSALERLREARRRGVSPLARRLPKLPKV